MEIKFSTLPDNLNPNLKSKIIIIFQSIIIIFLLLLIYILMFFYTKNANLKLINTIQKENYIPLPSWNDCAAKSNLIEYINNISNIPKEYRIAVFDLDGTLFQESDPVYNDWKLYQYRILNDSNYKATEEQKKIANKLTKAIKSHEMPDDLNVEISYSAAEVFKNMTLEEFKVLFHKLPITLTQIAFGIGDLQDLDAEMWKIFDYCRHNDYQEVIPNVTINGNFLTYEKAHKLKELMGAISVSHYNDTCFDAVKMLTDIGMKQINIHQLISEDTYRECLDLIDSVKKDKRLSKLNAVVFLMLKPKGRGTSLKPITKEHYKEIIDKCIKENINFGMDSCSACMFDNITKGKYKKYIEPCESFGLFSCYFNVDGKYFPCSFCEGQGEWKEGLEIKTDFLKDIWYNKKITILKIVECVSFM